MGTVATLSKPDASLYVRNLRYKQDGSIFCTQTAKNEEADLSALDRVRSKNK